MASSGESSAMKHVLYTLRTSSVPDELSDVSAQEALVATSLERYNFSKELMLISRYADLEQRGSFKRKEKDIVATAAAAAVAASQNKQDGNTQTTPLQTTPVKQPTAEAEAAPAAPTAAQAGLPTAGLPTAGLPTAGLPVSPATGTLTVDPMIQSTSPATAVDPAMAPSTPSYPAVALPAVAASLQAEAEAVVAAPLPPYKPPRAAALSNNDKVIDMMQRTKQSRETCIFYLESMDWNIDAAMGIFRDLTEN